MLNKLRRVYRPELYQGPRRLRRYFEGWYYKVASDERAFALIPGVSRTPDDPHAFIQLIDGATGEAAYHRFPLESFEYGTRDFWISVDGNRFHADGFEVSLPSFQASFSFSDHVRWHGTLLSPGTMGPYSFVPFMECRHGIIVMDALASGEVDGDRVEGRFYLEKDYGRSFPNAWIWLQSNSFGEHGVSVTCSIANVPFVGGAFTGFLAGIAVGGRVEQFTTYQGCRIESLEVREREVVLELRDSRRRLSITAVREPGSELRAPREGAMSGRIVESLRSSVTVEFSVDDRPVFRGRGGHAGLEVVNPELLLVPARPRQ